MISLKYIIIVVFCSALAACTTTTAQKLRSAKIFANLGDGIHSDHYFFISNYLANDLPSIERRKRLENNYYSSIENLEKPEVNRFLSSEFSHLVGGIARANKLESAAVYDKYGVALALFAPKTKLPLFLDVTESKLAKKNSWEKIGLGSFITTRVIYDSNKNILGFSSIVASQKEFDHFLL